MNKLKVTKRYLHCKALICYSSFDVIIELEIKKLYQCIFEVYLDDLTL